MLDLSKSFNHDKPIERAFRFEPASGGLPMRLVLRYIPSGEREEVQKKAKDRLIANPRFHELRDLEAQQRVLQEIVDHVLVNSIVSLTSVIPMEDSPDRFKPVTFKHLRSILPLNRDEVAKMGGWDQSIPLDMTVEMSDADREATRDNLLRILKAAQRLHDYINQITADVAYFQDQDWEDGQLKNSAPGAGSSSAPGSQDSRATAAAAIES